MQVAGNQYSLDLGARAQKRGILSILTQCCGTGRAVHDDLFGKKWVQVFDPRGGGRG